MTPKGTDFWKSLLVQQRRLQFADVAGARAALLLPISDRLLTGIVAHLMPRSSPVRELEIRAMPRNELALRVRLKRPALLPAVRLSMTIAAQPQLPENPVLALDVRFKGVGRLAGVALGFLDALPEGFAWHQNRLTVDLAALAGRFGLEELFQHLEKLELSSDAGRLIIAAEAAASPAAGADA